MKTSTAPLTALSAADMEMLVLGHWSCTDQAGFFYDPEISANADWLEEVVDAAKAEVLEVMLSTEEVEDEDELSEVIDEISRREFAYGFSRKEKAEAVLFMKSRQ